ncbi:protein Shroom3 [Pempheris klunzingeri]|uniref:protein Shroom3 n=1 Tax=Pempheris klunzingeri TaxID=3127111 RepID=UPI003980A4E9
MESGGRAVLRQGGGWVLVEARLQGGAPWGFTLQGGLEHGEPLIISKVEEGGKADTVERPLMVGDEIITINEVELSGFRQEAIALVKGSYKTLQLTVRREFDPGFIEEFGSSRPSLPALPSSSPPPLSSQLLPPPPPPPPQQQTPPSPHHSRPCSAGGVQLRIKNRRTDSASRPHSWHSTKLGEGQREMNHGGMDMMSNAWHSYHASASTTDLSGGFDSGGSKLRKSPDQYSSRGSMESLDPPQSSQLHPGAQHHHPLGHHTHSGPHPPYSSCHQLSFARSSNSIDHLHSKRDSAYSSFSTSSSIPEYLASTPSFSPERSYSLETVPQRGGGSEEMQQADIRYVRTVYDAQQGLSQDHELSSTSAALLCNNDSRGGGGARAGLNRDLQGSVGGVCYRGGSSSSSGGSSSSSGGSSGSGVPATNRHSVGPIWGPTASRSSYESLKGAPAPPRRSDSYAAIRNHERPNSWSSLEHARSLRSLQKGSWHHSSGPVASGAAKGSYGAEGQLHTVIEKSPESSPTTKPRQGGGFAQPPSPTGPSCGTAGHTSQSGWLILPTGMYPVPQPEPHYAQMPTTSPGPESSGVYPALTKESSRQPHHGLQVEKRERERNEGATEGLRDGWMSSAENGYQNNTSSSPYPLSSSSASASTQFRAQAHEADRPQQEDSNLQYRHHPKTAGGGSESQTAAQRFQNHPPPHGQNIQGSHIHTSQGPHSQVFQKQNQNFHVSHIPSTDGFRPPSSHEWKEPCTPVQSRGDRSRSMDQTSIHSEPMASSRLAQGQVPPTHLPAQPLPQAPPPSSSQHSPRHLSDSAALPYQHWDHREQDKDKEHPLTRLEIALAEVQRCTSPNSAISTSSHGNNTSVDGTQEPARSLSVLEKVSRFERREHSGKQRSHSTTNAHNKATHLRMTEKGCNSSCGADDLRDMLERSTNGTKAHRTQSYRGGSSEHRTQKYSTPADPSSVLQRSRSSYQLEESREGDSNKDFPWRQDIQEMQGSMQETSAPRSYRDSLKDAQSKVLRSTSFRRRDFSSSISPPPPTAPPSFSSSSSHQPPPVPAKHHSLEKKGPKTMPKPQGIIIMPQSPPPVTSPHTPKERHVVSPEIRGPSPPALPSVPPVGPPALTRICGRKRLGVDQKKRSYSEPESMNEVGVSDAETAALFRRGGETSVADRRKMFELAASRVGDGALQNAKSRPDLRQLQHNALAEYVERKRGVKRDKGGQNSVPRPRSAYLQPENRSHTVSSCHSDTLSLSSTSSLLSLQDSSADRSSSSGERRLCSTLPPGADLRSFESNLFYPGRVTMPRPPAHPLPSAPSGSPPELQAPVLSRDPGLDHQELAAEPQIELGLSKQLNGALQQAWLARGSGKSASAEDLLERSEERQTTSQHYRSHSSPAVERLNQDFPPGDARVFGVFVSEHGRRSLAEDRSADVHISGDHVSPQLAQNSLNTIQPAGPSADPGSSHTPVTRRERQRHSERQRTNSTSTLAASVGLPCPFSPPGTQDGGRTEWHASERLSQANLDAITFPSILHGSTGDDANAADNNETVVTDRQMRHSLSDASVLEDTPTDVYRGRAFSLEMRGDAQRVSPVTPSPLAHFQPAPPLSRKVSGGAASSPPPSSDPSIRQHLSSLRISESSFFSPTEQHQPLEPDLSQEDFDEVFLQNPAPPSPPPQIKETSTMEDFPPLPPPPPLLAFEQEAGPQTVESPNMELNNSIIHTGKSSLHSPPMSPSSSIFPSHLPSLLPSLKPQPSTITSIPTSTTTEDSLGLEYQPLAKREKTSEELQVQALARQLVLQDGSLAPLLDTWGSKSTVEIMEEIFPNSRLVGKSPWQRRGSNRVDDRIQDGICDPVRSTATHRGKETDLDDNEKDLNTRKVELCEALGRSVAALRQEKEALCEEQRRHQALGSNMESLVQERLKTNERDKYSMFIGDLERIVNLLLSLCSRLSRIDKSLLALEREELTQGDTAEERDSLHHKRSLILRQTEDAWELKENLDRRQRVVHAILCGYLTDLQLQDYRRFVSTKPSLLIRQRHLDDLIRQGDEQLTRLAESMPQDLAEAHGWSRACLFSSSSPATCSSPFQLLLPPSVVPGSTHSVRSTTVTSL